MFVSYNLRPGFDLYYICMPAKDGKQEKPIKNEWNSYWSVVVILFFSQTEMENIFYLHFVVVVVTTDANKELTSKNGK